MTSDKVRTALRGELMLLLDKRHLQRWGVKEYVSPFRFALPQVAGADLFVMDREVPAWRYPEASVFRKMAENFPETGAAARNQPMPDAGEVRAWLEANAPGLYDAEFDLLYKSRYDFQVYVSAASSARLKSSMINGAEELSVPCPRTKMPTLSSPD